MAQHSPTRSVARFALLGALGLSLSGCVVGTVVGAGAAVVGGTAKATGAVIGAGVDAVTTSDEEERAKRERAQREHEREQRRCERRQRQGKNC
jgi:carbonic anhydrase/acetyltransferase-like protein (isoleucine patch superfamily)